MSSYSYTNGCTSNLFDVYKQYSLGDTSMMAFFDNPSKNWSPHTIENTKYKTPLSPIDDQPNARGRPRTNQEERNSNHTLNDYQKHVQSNMSYFVKQGYTNNDALAKCAQSWRIKQGN